MDAQPLHDLAKSPQSLRFPPQFSAVLRMKSQLAAAAGQVPQLHRVACEFTPACGPGLMRFPELLLTAKKKWWNVYFSLALTKQLSYD